MRVSTAVRVSTAALGTALNAHLCAFLCFSPPSYFGSALCALCKGGIAPCALAPPCALAHGNRSFAELTSSPASAGGSGSSRRGGCVPVCLVRDVRGLPFYVFVRAAGVGAALRAGLRPTPCKGAALDLLGLCPRPRQGLARPWNRAILPTFARLLFFVRHPRFFSQSFSPPSNFGAALCAPSKGGITPCALALCAHLQKAEGGAGTGVPASSTAFRFSS